MRTLLNVLTLLAGSVIAASAAPVPPLNIGPESNYTHTLKILATRQAWRDALGILDPTGVTFNSSQFDTSGDITLIDVTGVNGVLWELVGGTIKPIDLSQPVRIPAGLYFDAGAEHLVKTNVNGVELDYTHDGPTAALSARTTGGDYVLLSAQAGAGIFQTGGGTVVLANGTKSIQLAGNMLIGNVAGHQVGSDGVPFGDSYWSGVQYVQGYSAGNNANYARQATYQTGADGWIEIDSQSVGTGGIPKGFRWRSNGVEIAWLDLASLSFAITNVTTHDGGRIGVGSGCFDLISTGDCLYLGNASHSVHFSGNQVLPNQTDIEWGGDGVEYAKVWTKILKLKGITKADKTALSAADGMVVYQTDNTPGLRAYVNGAWVMLSSVPDP